MGKHSVIFHAFLACLVPLADAIGVAPSGLSSPDFYRSRRFRTTNSTPLRASIHNSAYAESAVVILDDLSRKSRVMLAHRKDGETHKLLTWNAGGGVPTPEYQGGEWEEMYADIEKMTGVLLFEIGGCTEKVGKFEGDYAKYKKRYETMSDDFKTWKKNAEDKKLPDEKSWLGDLQKLQQKGGVGGLLKGLTAKSVGIKGKADDKPPSWAKDECTTAEAVGRVMELCGKKPKETDPKPCGDFDVKAEGCWKKRGALPVYSKRFFELYGLRKTGKDTDYAAYWTKYVEGLQKQTVTEEKGCGPKGWDKKTGQPGKHVLTNTGEEVKYDDGTTVKTPEMFTFEVWSRTAFWDALVLDLTDLSIRILTDNGMGQPWKGDDGKPKAITLIDDDTAGKTITKIVAGAQKQLNPDVVFLQEAGMVGEGSYSYDLRKAPSDTSIMVRTDFGGGIDDEASDHLQAAWDAMMTGIRDPIDTEINKVKKEIKKLTKITSKIAAGEELSEDEKKEAPPDMTVELAKKDIKKKTENAWALFPFQTLPDILTKDLSKVHTEYGESKGEKERKNAEEKATDQTEDEKKKAGEKAKKQVTKKQAENAKTQQEEIDGLMPASKGHAYATAEKKDLVTVAVTAEEPRVLLLSIHSDGDGYFCAEYLNLAVKFYSAINKKLPLSRMYIGMDANVQPPPGDLSQEAKKGYTYEQLRRVLPSKMDMLDPKVETVKKVRTFLQTQFPKIGKDDKERKDLLFVYPDVTGSETKVYNKYDDKKNEVMELSQAGTAAYYPKNEWPVDHFMSYATVPVTSVVTKDEHAAVKGAKTVAGKICGVLKRTVRKAKYKVKGCVSKLWKKKEGDKKVGDNEWAEAGTKVGTLALDELRKPPAVDTK